MNTDATTPAPTIVDRATYQAEVDALRVREKVHTRQGDALAAARRRLPMMEVDGTLTLTGENGPVTLLEVFEGRRLLIAYFHMWHAGQPAPGQCEGCTFFNGQVRELSYLHARDVTYATLCQGPYDVTVGYRDFMGWDVPWYSAQDSLTALLGDPQRSMSPIVCYLRDGDRVFETYWTSGRGLEPMSNTYGLLDLTVYGRQETWEDSPAGWPQDVRADSNQWRTNRRPTAQWSRLQAGRDDDLSVAGPSRSGPESQPPVSRGEREFSPDQATDALRRACPGIDVKDARRLHQGYSGQHWVFATDEGELLLRTSSPDGPEHLRHLLAATRRAAQAGVPTVRFRSFVPYDAVTDGPLLVQEFGPGRSASDAFPELTAEQRARVGADLGRLVALLHTERGTAYADVLGRDVYPTATDWALSELERCLPIVCEVAIEGSWDELARRVRRRMEANQPGVPTLLHRDIYFDNILLVERPEPRVTAILDFERARYGDQFEDFGKLDDVVFDLWPDTREGFLAAYTEVHPIGPGEEHRIHAYVGLYNIVMMAHFATGTQRQYVPDYVARVATWLQRDQSR